jgi:maltose alpha-D-glucosyltransferase/alpha-amylase
VLLDLVVNHTSDQHQWFQEARSDKESKYRAWYVWSKERPEDWDEGMVFPGVQERTWTFDRKAKEYYFHRFYEFQPDLNLDNEAVRQEIARIMGYWLQLGADGFRVDAVPFIIESKWPGKPHKLIFDYLTEMRRFVQWRSANGVLLGEANVVPDEARQYFGEHDDGLHLMFNFWVNQHLFLSLAKHDARPLAKAIEETSDIPARAQWAHFLRNHDELDLGRLSDEDRKLVFQRFGPKENMQLYHRGIRRRLAPMLGEADQIELAYSLLFSLPGTPVLRYGDEIGMGDNLRLKQREAVRTPMHWSDTHQAGFSTASRLVHPVIATGEYGYPQVNVEYQLRDRQSLLHWTIDMIRLRKSCPEIGWGQCQVLPCDEPSILALHHSWGSRSLLVVHNLSDQPRQTRLTVPAGRAQLVSHLTGKTLKAQSKDRYRIQLEKFGYDWYRIHDDSLDYG